MAYILNPRQQGGLEVLAVQFQRKEGYFHFLNSKNELVRLVREDQVIELEVK